VGYLLLGIVAGLAAVERKGFLQAMLSRPIALAPLTGLVLGDVTGGLAVAAPLELLWLGAVNLGAALPVHEALGTVAVAGGAVLAGQALGTGVTPALAVLSLLAGAPLALLGRRADRFVEVANERLALFAEDALRRHHPHAAVRLNLAGLAMPFGIAAVLAPAGALVASQLAVAVLTTAPGLDGPLRVGWWAFCGLACAAGARALRARRAGVIFSVSAAAALLLGVVLRVTP
jgi:mannose/fructose/N-acetylgalactosamine-specific phosphotransferase system component IIC